RRRNCLTRVVDNSYHIYFSFLNKDNRNCTISSKTDLEGCTEGLSLGRGIGLGVTEIVSTGFCVSSKGNNNKRRVAHPICLSTWFGSNLPSATYFPFVY